MKIDITIKKIMQKNDINSIWRGDLVLFEECTKLRNTKYKKDFEFTEKMENELFYCAKLSAELDSRMDSLRDLVQADAKYLQQ